MSNIKTSIETTMMVDNDTTTFHKLSGGWTLWVHLPHNTDWSIKSYIKLSTFDTVEKAIAIMKTIPSILVTNCMLFLMRDGIMPMWEDPNNKEGGCFSYKVMNPVVYQIWNDLAFCVMGNTTSSNKAFVDNITGITVSPKKTWCIIKIWTRTKNNTKLQDPSLVTAPIPNFGPKGCIFKGHGEK